MRLQVHQLLLREVQDVQAGREDVRVQLRMDPSTIDYATGATEIRPKEKKRKEIGACECVAN